MTEYITFAPKDPAGVLLPKAYISIMDASNQIVVTDIPFGYALDDLTIGTVILAEGDYTLWCRAFGYIFPFLLPFTVAEDDGPTEATARIIDVQATSTSVDPVTSTAGWALVTGHVGEDVPALVPDRAAQGYAVIERFQTGSVQRSRRLVQIWRVSPTIVGEAQTLQDREFMTVAVDNNGYFEVMLPPEILYRAGLPNVAGRPYFTSPSAGVSADIKTLIDAGRTSSPYDLIGGS